MNSTTRIADVRARQILDSRGRPTVEADVTLASGIVGRASVPSGASTGRHEARELRDGDADSYEGMGVLAAVTNIHDVIAPAVVGHDPCDQAGLDAAMIALDGTESFENLGANAVLAVSIAACRAAAMARGVALHEHISLISGGPGPSMPMPMTNILSGGAHAGRSMDIQDFLAIPVGAQNYADALSMLSKVRSAATRLLADQGCTTLLADEGGLAPGFNDPVHAMDMMVNTVTAAGLRPGEDVAITLDIAASELFDGKHYVLPGAGLTLTSAEMIAYIEKLVRAYPIVSVEDILDQDDWSGWRDATARLGDIQLVGDDLLVTNASRIASAAERGVANSVLIKVNQNGTLSGTFAAINQARKVGFATVISARSGETEDPFLADLAVGTGGGQIKIGSVRNSERLAKYNQLLRISEDASITFERWHRAAAPQR